MANVARSYDVEIVPCTPRADGLAWRAMYVGHVPDSRNAMRHNVYINVDDEGNQELRRATDVKIVWGWEGQRPDEQSTALLLDKPAPEWMTNIPLFLGQRVWCRVDGRGIPSDTVRGLHTAHAQEGDGTAPGHHSFEIMFQLCRSVVEPQPVIEPEPHDSAALMQLADRLQALVDVLREIVEYQTQAKG